MATGSEYGFFWNSENGDRTYDAESFETWLKKFFTSGVFTGDYMVTSTSGMTISVHGGYANLDGKVLFTSQETLITLEAPNSLFPRIDTVIIERNDTNREIKIDKVTGAYNGDNPVPTPPVRGGGIFQIVLAQIYIGAGASGITQANITDTRPDSDICGIVSGTVQEMDFSQFSEQFNEYLREYSAGLDDYARQVQQDMQQFEAENKAAFEEWFAELQDELSGDVAANLQNQINEANEKLSLLEHMTLQNDFTAPIVTDDSNVTLITDDLGYAILADWKYEEV